MAQIHENKVFGFQGFFLRLRTLTIGKEEPGNEEGSKLSSGNFATRQGFQQLAK